MSTKILLIDAPAPGGTMGRGPTRETFRPSGLRDDVPDGSAREPIRVDRAQIEAWRLSGDDLSDELAGDRSEREAEHGVAGRHDEVLPAARTADHRQAVRRAGSETAPQFDERELVRQREELPRAALDGCDARAIDRHVEAGELEGASEPDNRTVVAAHRRDGDARLG